jgi:hypothetical protein
MGATAPRPKSRAGSRSAGKQRPSGTASPCGLPIGPLPATARAWAHFAMPPFAWRVDDQEIADVSGFVRGNWGSDVAAVGPSEVAKLRKGMKVAELAGRRGSAAADARAMFQTAAPLYGVDGGPAGTPAHADSSDANASALQVRFVIIDLDLTVMRHPQASPTTTGVAPALDDCRAERAAVLFPSRAGTR